MKTILSVILIVVSVFTSSAAEKKPGDLFRAGEFQLDGNSSFKTGDLRSFEPSGGIGLNYFPYRAAGFGIEADTSGFDSAAIDRIGVSVIGRMPLESLRLAPEFKLGSVNDFEVSGRHDGRDSNGVQLFAGAGAEFRITKSFGIGAEVRGVKPLNQSSEFVTGILRCRLNF